MGVLRQILAPPAKAHHRLSRLGQTCEGLESDQLQAEGRSEGPQILHQHSDCLSGWFPMCLWRQGGCYPAQLLSLSICLERQGAG